MVRILFFCVVAMVISQHAKAQDKPIFNKEQKNVIKHAGEAFVMAEFCPAFKVNKDLMFLGLYKYGLLKDAIKDQTTEAIASEIDRARKDGAEFKNNLLAACLAAEMMFGGKGKNVPNMLVWDQ